MVTRISVIFCVSLQYAGRGTNITEIMNPWLYNLNYPVITMQLLPDNKINITQKRFLRDTLADPNSPVSEYGLEYIDILLSQCAYSVPHRAVEIQNLCDFHL